MKAYVACHHDDFRQFLSLPANPIESLVFSLYWALLLQWSHQLVPVQGLCSGTSTSLVELSPCNLDPHAMILEATVMFSCGAD